MFDQKSERIPKHPEGPLDTKGRSMAEAAMPDRSLAALVKDPENKARLPEKKYSSLTIGIIKKRLFVLHQGFQNHDLIHYLAKKDGEKAIIIMPGVEPEEVQGLPAMVDFVILMPDVDPRIVNFLPPSVKCIYLQAQEKYFSYEKRKVIAALPCQTFVITGKTTVEDARSLPASISRICITRDAVPEVVAALPRKPGYEFSIVLGAKHDLLTVDLLRNAKSLTLFDYLFSTEAENYFKALVKKPAGFLHRLAFPPIEIITNKPKLSAAPINKREQEAQDWPPSDEDDYLYHHFGVLFKLSPVSPGWLLSQFASQPIAALKSKIINAASHPQGGSRGFWLFMKAAVEKEQCGSIDKQRETLVTLFPTLKLAMKFLKDFQEKYPTCKTPIFSACSFDLPDEHQRGTWHIWQELAVKYMLEPGFKELLPYAGKVQEILLTWGITLTNDTPLEALLAAAACLAAHYEPQSKEGERLQEIALLAVNTRNKLVSDEKQEASCAAHTSFFYQEARNALRLGSFRKAYFLLLVVLHDKKAASDLRTFAQIRLFRMYTNNNCWIKKDEALASVIYRPQIDKSLPELEKAGLKSGEFLHLKALYDLSNGVAIEKVLLPIQQAADANYAPAKIFLIMCDELGLGVTQNKIKAVTAYQELAKEPTSDSEAQYYAGNACLREKPPNLKQARLYFKEAAKQGDAQAQRDLGWCYYHLSLDKEDIKKTPQEKLREQQKAFSWLMRAADQAEPGALHLLARFYKDGLNGLPRDPQMADSFYKQAAMQNHIPSLLHIAIARQKANVEENQQAMFSLCQQIGLHNPAVLYFLGRAYFDGAGVWKNPRKAFFYFEKAVKTFESEKIALRHQVEERIYEDQVFLILPNLLLYFAKCYEYGLGIARDEVRAILNYQRAAKRDNLEACVCLVRLKLEKGEIEGENGAHFWHDRAIRSGQADILCTVAETYRLAAESKKADEKTANSLHKQAIELYGQASKQGYPKANLALAEHYYRLGKGGFTENLREARALCKAAAEKGDLAAMYTYGEYCRTGVGGERSFVEARAWLEKAANGGHVDAQVALAIMSFSTGPKEFTATFNHTVAVNALEAAANQGNASAQSQLGICYRKGKFGKPQDYQKAISLFEEAAERGDSEGRWQLAMCYYNRLGVPKDEKRALAYCQQAAENNHPLACNHMAKSYEIGWPGAGIQKNTLKAIQWLEKFLFAQVNCHLDNAKGYSFLEKISCHLSKGVNPTGMDMASEIQRIFQTLPPDLCSPDLDLVNYRRRYAALVIHPAPPALANALTKLHQHMEKLKQGAGGLPHNTYLELEPILWQSHEPEMLANLIVQYLLPMGGSIDPAILTFLQDDFYIRLTANEFSRLYSLIIDPLERQKSAVAWIKSYISTKELIAAGRSAGKPKPKEVKMPVSVPAGSSHAPQGSQPSYAVSESKESGRPVSATPPTRPALPLQQVSRERQARKGRKGKKPVVDEKSEVEGESKPERERKKRGRGDNGGSRSSVHVGYKKPRVGSPSMPPQPLPLVQQPLAARPEVLSSLPPAPMAQPQAVPDIARPPIGAQGFLPPPAPAVSRTLEAPAPSSPDVDPLMVLARAAPPPDPALLPQQQDQQAASNLAPRGGFFSQTRSPLQQGRPIDLSSQSQGQSPPSGDQSKKRKR